jgi:uncharacterized RDD family membrane protein YckC
MKPAGFWIRFAAVVIDGLVFSVITIPLMFLSAGHRELSLFSQFISTVPFQVYVVACHWRWGKTLGKAALGIKVESMDGARITLVQSMLRSSVDTGFAFLGMALNVMAILSIPPSEFSTLTWLKTGKALSEAVPSITIVGFSAGFWVLGSAVVLAAHPLKRAIHDLIANTKVCYGT